MKTIIAGSRIFDDYTVFIEGMEKVPFNITEIISGCAPGADTMGEALAAELGLPVHLFPADWNKHGKAAGPIRNGQMAKEADALVAFLTRNSKGTANMIAQAEKKNIPIFILNIDYTKTEIDGEEVINWFLKSFEYRGQWERKQQLWDEDGLV